MKGKKHIKKKQVVMALLVAALGAAVWLNMQYSSSAGTFLKDKSTASQSKNLGDTKYVVNQNQSEPTATQTAAAEADYFTTARADRKKSRNDAIALLEETAKKSDISKEAKQAAETKMSEIADRMQKETSIESVIKAKGFEDAVVIIGDNDVNVVVKSSELLQSQTLQIQDAVTSQTEVALEKIKIVNRK